MQLRAVDDGEAEVAGGNASLFALQLPLLVVGQVGRVVLASGDALSNNKYLITYICNKEFLEDLQTK